MKIKNGDKDTDGSPIYHARLTWGDVCKVAGAVIVCAGAVAGVARYNGLHPDGVKASENRLTRIESSQATTQEQLQKIVTSLELHLQQTSHGYERLAVTEARTLDLHSRLTELERRIRNQGP